MTYYDILVTLKIVAVLEGFILISIIGLIYLTVKLHNREE